MTSKATTLGGASPALEPAPAADRPAPPPPPGGLDVEAVRRDFPILATEVRGHPLAYFDNAASTQKPSVVIDAVAQFYREKNANIHRGVHHLSQLATAAYESARDTLARFINAPHRREVVFVRGATEGINLVAHSFGAAHLREGDEVILTELEHHANIVPWQLVCEARGAKIRVVPMDDRGVLDLDAFEKLLGPRTKIAALSSASNALGTVNPVKAMIAAAHREGVPVLLDAAQAAPHYPVDVQDLDCDFLVFSGHKTFGPTGIGVLYGKTEQLNPLPPYQGGGDMIRSVSFEGTTYRDIPERFEAGTPHISGVVGMARAVDYLEGLGWDRLQAHEHRLATHAAEVLTGVEGVRLVGESPDRTSVFSFLLEGVHPHDIGTALDNVGIAVRAGHHCAQPIMQHFKIPGTARASFAFYNTLEEIDRLADALGETYRLFNS